MQSYLVKFRRFKNSLGRTDRTDAAKNAGGFLVVEAEILEIVEHVEKRKRALGGLLLQELARAGLDLVGGVVVEALDHGDLVEIDEGEVLHVRKAFGGEGGR